MPRQPLASGDHGLRNCQTSLRQKGRGAGPSLARPRPSREAKPAGAGKLCPGESLKSIFSARHPSPLRLRGGRAKGVWGESPAPAGVCVVWVWGPRGRAPSAFAPPAAPAPLAPAGVARQHGPGRGAAEDRQKAGEDGRQEEHGEAAEFGPRPPPPGGAARASQESRGRVLAGRPGGACGTPGPEGGAAGAGRSATWGLLRTPGVGVCPAQGAGQDRAGRRDEAYARLSGPAGFRGPGWLAQGPGKRAKRPGPGKGLSESGDSKAKSREWWRQRGGGEGGTARGVWIAKSWVPEKGQRNLS